MHTLDGRPVLVVTSAGSPVSVGKFSIIHPDFIGQPDRLELAFETDSLACRLRVSSDKIAEIKASWTGEMFRYVLPAEDKVWLSRFTDKPSAEPTTP